MNCPNCGAREEHVVVNSVAFCRVCGPKVWAKGGAAAASLAAPDTEEVVVVAAQRPRSR